jgi:Hpt domain
MPDLEGDQTSAAIRRRSNMRLAAKSPYGLADSRPRAARVGSAAYLARPVTRRAVLGTVERDVSRPESWQRDYYEEWVSRLGAERMRGFLVNLADQFAALGDTARDGGDEALQRLAHDVASTGGMLGFLEVTRCCRAVLESDAGSAREARDTLGRAVDEAIDCLAEHLATQRRSAA